MAKPSLPLIMGIVNVTPDSFSDGGRYWEPTSAVQHAQYLVEQGADFIDLGAESSRPGAQPISSEEEWQRLEPVFEGLAQKNLLSRVTVDTYHPETIERLLSIDIAGINNILGLCSQTLLKKIADTTSFIYIAMHCWQTPTIMQQKPLSASQAWTKVQAFFQEAYHVLQDCGFEARRIFLDPGIGFGKTTAANLTLLAEVYKWSQEYQLLVGVSRKSFMGALLDIDKPVDRDPPSKMLEWALMSQGVRVIRTHDVGPLVRMRDVWLGER